MQIPLIIKSLTSVVTLTGLYSFEFVDKKRNTITEIFFMIPPKKKELVENTRSTTNPTLSSNYNTDAGNGTKKVTLSGELFFPYVGSPNNPVAADSSELENQIDGLTEFAKLQWMLIRYRDYTMTPNGTVLIPTTVLSASPEVSALYTKVAELVKSKVGALYDQIQLIFHDYDMDDHYYCRVGSLTSSQTDSRHKAVEYTIDLELYERDTMQSSYSVEIKKTVNESVDSYNSLIQGITFSESFNEIQMQINYASTFYQSVLKIIALLDEIDAENEKIQAGTSTALTLMPKLLSNLIEQTGIAQDSIIGLFFTPDQATNLASGDMTIDEVLDNNVLSFFNNLQKLELYATGLTGILKSIPEQEEIRYYSNADDYTLNSDQFESDSAFTVLNDMSFKYYTVQEGDTARIIALRELKDAEKYISILKINSITDSELIEGTLIGQKIKIPIETSSLSRSEYNLVYESDDSDIDKFLHGSDIGLGLNKEILISATGDIFGKVGIEVTYDSLLNRLNTQKGSLNVFSPNWGLTPIGDGNAPLMVRIERYLTDLSNQIQADPRVETLNLDLSQLNLEGENITVKGKVNFIGKEESREVEI
jgi:LysM repeat protein